MCYGVAVSVACPWHESLDCRKIVAALFRMDNGYHNFALDHILLEKEPTLRGVELSDDAHAGPVETVGNACITLQSPCDLN